MRTLRATCIAFALLGLAAAATAQQLVFNTRVGMTIDEVLAAVTGSVRADPPGRSGNFDPCVQFHVRYEPAVAGVPLRVFFGFVDGALHHVEIVAFVDGTHNEQVLAGRRLYQVLVERFGPPLSTNETVSPPNAPPAFRDLYLLRAVGYTSSVSTRFTFAITNGSAAGTVFISHPPSGF